MTTTTAPLAPGDILIGFTEAGQRIGLSYWAIRDRVRAGVLPAYRTGTSAMRVKASDVDALLTRVAPSEIPQRD
jgi:excisionase family DNA binding protein